MRTTTPSQLKLGELDIASIKISARSRDDIPQILRGLQYLYGERELREQIFAILTKLTPIDVDTNIGRPGMDWWKILVMGTIRLNLNCDFDRLHELANEHRTIRQMLGHGFCDDDKEYALQTIKDNVQLFTPEILDEINQVVVNAGLKLKKKEQIMARCDSFVVETDVHYPTDINLLYDAVRKAISGTAQYAEGLGINGWRQSGYNIRQVKRAYRQAQQLKRSTSQHEEKKQLRLDKIAQAHRDLIALCLTFINKITDTLSTPSSQTTLISSVQYMQIQKYIAHAKRQIDQIERRVLQGEVIPHEEKVFSIFQPHTEWINKGKAGVPVELGLRVCIVESTGGYILHHQVMQQTTDSDIAVSIITETQARYANLIGCSFDKGFHSPANQIELAKKLETTVLPKKGKRNKIEVKRESDVEFRQKKRQHSAVESGINALEIHGLDKCPDNGLHGFKRYVGLAILARNIQKLGAGLNKVQLLKEKRQRERDKLAA